MVQHIISFNKSGPQEIFIFWEKKMRMSTSILPGSMLTPAHLNFSSGWEYLGKIDYSHRKMRALLLISLTWKIGMTQKQLTPDPDSLKL